MHERVNLQSLDKCSIDTLKGYKHATLNRFNLNDPNTDKYNTRFAIKNFTINNTSGKISKNNYENIKTLGT